MNYTKGEWKLVQPKSGTLLIVSGNKNIASTSTATSIEDAQEVLGNAYLIASAPDMYEALLAVYQDIELQNVDGGSAELNLIVQKALAKAEGK